MVEEHPRLLFAVDISIDERQFLATHPVYATVPHVTFDGFNYHLVFFSATPVPITEEGTSQRVTVAARLVLPPVVAEATVTALYDALQHPTISGPFASARTVPGRESDHE